MKGQLSCIMLLAAATVGSAAVYGERDCTHNGKTIPHGRDYMDVCHFCICVNGEGKCPDKNNKICTFRAGTCPGLTSKYCATLSELWDCYDDWNCPTTEKCCSCDTAGMLGKCVTLLKDCEHNGKLYPHGTLFKYECNDCRCNDGKAECTNTCVDCGKLNIRQFRHGVIAQPTTTQGSAATLTCIPGYQLIGKNERTCLPSGQWSGDFPTCKAVCDKHTINDGAVTWSSHPLNPSMPLRTEGSWAEYVCFEGYILVGKDTRVCIETSRGGIPRGIWTGKAPTCKAECDAPTIQHGTIERPFQLIDGASVTYKCNEGYTLVGQSYQTCLSTGYWSGKAPVCKQVNCYLLSQINGYITYHPSTTQRSVATIKCHTGYQLIGENERTCLPSGQWSGDYPTCIAECDKHTIKNGEVTFFNRTHFGPRTPVGNRTEGSVALYTCYKGILVGNNHRRCLSTSAWSGKAPTCTVICDAPIIKYGTVESSSGVLTPGIIATYRCNKGYTLVGRHTTQTCLSTGVWSGESPVCQVMCDAPTIQYGTVGWSSLTTNSVATYTCNQGFILVGQTTRTCLSRGSRSGNSPICEWVPRRKILSCVRPPCNLG